MIKRCNYSEEMWAKKSDIDTRFNALFLTQAFRSFIVLNVKYCPNDLNFDTVFEDDGRIALLCCMKHYGYDSTANNGQPGSDLGDYETECFKGDEGEKYLPLMCKFISERDPDLSAALANIDCPIYW